MLIPSATGPHCSPKNDILDFSNELVLPHYDPPENRQPHTENDMSSHQNRTEAASRVTTTKSLENMTCRNTKTTIDTNRLKALANITFQEVQRVVATLLPSISSNTLVFDGGNAKLKQSTIRIIRSHPGKYHY